MLFRAFLISLLTGMAVFSQSSADRPPIETGVSHTLAKWRAEHYSDVRYKLDLTLEKMSPVLKGSMEIRVKVSEPPVSAGGQLVKTGPTPIILDWRKLVGHEKDSTVSNVTINGKAVSISANRPLADAGGSEFNDHLILGEGVKPGENVITLDFTSPILTSGSAITRYIDKEDGSEYIYSLFVPSDASTAFPVFDQPDLKARFGLIVQIAGRDRDPDWKVISNAPGKAGFDSTWTTMWNFNETKPISTYVFAFAVGPWERVKYSEAKTRNVKPELKEAYKKWVNNDISIFVSSEDSARMRNEENERLLKGYTSDSTDFTHIYIRKSQAAKFQPHAAEVFRLVHEDIKYLEEYFDYKFPFPKYDLVLIPEFPFGGMEHAGATFVRESSIIFPTEPTKSDEINRAVLLFHETAHQWFGDTVTMKWFDDLWLKEGFANFMAYKAMEKIMPETNAWKVFYERIKQPAYATDSTRGTTPIYQPIENLSAAKSAYGNIVYNKAPAFLRQAEFYLGEDKFQTAVRSFLKKHEYGNATWEDLVKELSSATGRDLNLWAKQWVTQPGMYIYHGERHDDWRYYYDKAKKAPPLIVVTPVDILDNQNNWSVATKFLLRYPNGSFDVQPEELRASKTLGGRTISFRQAQKPSFIFPNYQDYGYGIFLLDEKSREYVLKNIQNEKDAFLRSMMYGALWDSVREGEMDPRRYVELAIANLKGETDETITQSILARTATALNYYIEEKGGDLSGSESARRSSSSRPNTIPNGPVSASTSGLRTRMENVLIDRVDNAASPGLRITYYRAFLGIVRSENARGLLKALLLQSGTASKTAVTLKPKDKFDIVTRLAMLGDPDAPKLLADLERTEKGDDARLYAYAAHAAFPAAANRAKFWNDFVSNKDISESWIEAAIGSFNAIGHDDLSLPYLQKALAELPELKRTRKIFFVNNWLNAFIGGQKSQAAFDVVNKFLADNPGLDNDLRLKILENVDIIERAVKIRSKFGAR